MNNQRWLELLRAELARTELSHEYRARLLCELEEHLADLMEENEMNGENLAADVIGAPQELANSAVRAQQRSWWQRAARFLFHVAAFGLLPLPLMVVAFTVILLGVGAIASGLEWALQTSFAEYEQVVIGEHPEVTKFVMVASGVLMASGTVVAEAWLARKMHAGRVWLLLASVILSLGMALLFVDIRHTGVVGQNQLTLGLMIFTSSSDYSLVQLAKGLVPLTIGIWMIKNSSAAQLAPSATT